MRVRLLIVDDEPAMVEILSRFLEPVCSQIESTDDLETALGLAKIHHFHVIILDLKLKRTGKDEALRAIREFKSHDSAVVVVSGIPEPHIKEEVLAAGADSYLAKDSGFTSRALLIATHVATTKLPRSAYTDDSFLSHVEVLKRMVEAK